jgi:hypothetical protein
MCEQCLAETKTFGEVIPHWWLVQATKEGWQMKPGDYGLVYMNDPDFIWPKELVPITDPTFGLSDEEEEAMDAGANGKWNEFIERVDKIDGNFWCEPATGYSLVNAAKEAGYDEEKHGYRLLSWLTHQMALVIQSNPTADEKIADELDKVREEKWGYSRNEHGILTNERAKGSVSI